MSIISDHLTDDSCRGMYSPSPDAVTQEIVRLASLYATARVRCFAVERGIAGPNETGANTIARAVKAKAALEAYVKGIV